MCSPAGIDTVIVNYHSASEVAQCLARLGPWPWGTLWLIDNSCDDTEAAALRHLVADKPWVQLHVAPQNLGFGRACNWAYQHSRSEHLLLLNPDARVAADAVLRMADTLRQHPRLGALSPKTYWDEQHRFLLPPAYALTPRTLALDIAATWSGAGTKRLARWQIERWRRFLASPAWAPVSFLAGAVLLLKRQAVEAAGGLFDPGYFMFFEDADLSVRLRRAGHALGMATQVNAVHTYRHKAGKAVLMHDSRQHYLRKFHPWLSRHFDQVQHLARPVVPARWFETLATPVRSAEAFTAATQGWGVAALSPSMLMRPCIFTASDEQAMPLDERLWEQLEPGVYVALLHPLDDRLSARWVFFERHPTAI